MAPVEFRRYGYPFGQLICWSSYLAVDSLTVLLNNGPLLEYSFSILTCALTGFLVTHVFRIYLKRHGWMGLPLPRLVPRLLAAMCIMAVVWSVGHMSVSIWVYHYPVINFIRHPATVIEYLWLYLIFTGMWSTAYFGYHFFNNYQAERYAHLQSQNVLKEAELRALKSRLNPHFLFNSLNSIRALIVESPEKARQMITLLSNTLRYALHSDLQQTVPLEAELAFVEDYLKIEGIRFEDRLRVDWQVDDATRSCPVPPMMVQTLVENAIKHGIARRPQGGSVEIRSRFENQSLVVEVSNDFQPGVKKTAEGTGLRNIRERLRHLYGEAAVCGLDLSRPDRAAARLVVPRHGGEPCAS